MHQSAVIPANIYKNIATASSAFKSFDPNAADPTRVAEGTCVGNVDGINCGKFDGFNDGVRVGVRVTGVGKTLEVGLGFGEGRAVGMHVGATVGKTVGLLVGVLLGRWVGLTVGLYVLVGPLLLGWLVGRGEIDGTAVGLLLG